MIQKTIAKISFVVISLGVLTTSKIAAQPNINELSQLGRATITSAVPFLMINPDARQGGMGDLGVGTDGENGYMHFNVAKMAFAKKDMRFGISYSPWLRALVPDINLAYLEFHKKVGSRFTVGASVRYFSLGDITFTDNTGNTIGRYNPNEFSIDAGVAIKLSPYWSAGVSMKFVYSNLTLGQFVQGQATNAGLGGGGDIGFYYENDEKKLFKKDVTWRFGVAINNIGSKIKYSEAQANGDFQPTNFRLGASSTVELDKYNKLMLALEINKLMIPSNAIYFKNVAGFDSVDAQGNRVIEYGLDPNRNAFEAMFTSFGDSPYGFLGEMNEVNFQIGAEYWYNNLLRVSTGFFYETPSSGNRQYFTLGAGVRYKMFGLDFSYLIPTVQNNPLQNTLRFTLGFHFDQMGKKSNEDKPKNQPK